MRRQPPPGNVNDVGLQRHIVLRRRFRLRLRRFGGHHRRGGVHLNHRRFGQLQRRRGVIPNLLGQRDVAVQLLTVARDDIVNTALPFR